MRIGVGKAEPFRTSDGKAIYPCLPTVMNTFSSQHKLIDAAAAVLSKRNPFCLARIKTILRFLMVLLVASFAPAQTNKTQERLENAGALIRDHRITEAEQQLNGILRTEPITWRPLISWAPFAHSREN